MPAATPFGRPQPALGRGCVTVSHPNRLPGGPTPRYLQFGFQGPSLFLVKSRRSEERSDVTVPTRETA